MILIVGTGLAGLTCARYLAEGGQPFIFAQFAQKPGIFEQLPENRTQLRGLYLAGEYTQSSSIQGAMQSGASAAKAVSETLRQTEDAS